MNVLEQESQNNLYIVLNSKTAFTIASNFKPF